MDRIKTSIFVILILALVIAFSYGQQKEKDHCDEIHGDWHYNYVFKKWECN